MLVKLRGKSLSVKELEKISLILKSYKLKIGLGILLSLIIISFLEPIITRCVLGDMDPLAPGTFEKFLSPSMEHLLGTDHYGRDYFILVLMGLKNSLLVGFLGALLSTLIATLVAFSSGYKGGLFDTIMNSVTNSMLILPTWVILASIVLYVRGIDIFAVSLLVALFIWPGSARSLRAQVLSLKNKPYVDLAIVSGESDIEIIFKELLPNLTPFIMFRFSSLIIGAIFFEVSLRVIGIGASEYISLGLLINWFLTRGAIGAGYYHIVFPPIVLLILIFSSINLINAGLDEIFNPRLKKVTGE
jgi:peptide/nickel transport system permease protein